MASRRRLDISSLLCDSDDTSASRADTHISRPPAGPAQSPVQAQQPSVQVASYPSDERRVLAKTSRQYGGAQYEQDQYQHQHQLGEQPSGPSPTFQENPRSLPSATALIPLALQPSPPRRRTPSPPYSLSSASPVDHGDRFRRGRHSGDLRDSGFPRPGSFSTQTRPLPHPYTQLPHPPSSTSPVNIHETVTARGRRVSAQLSHHQYSPTSLTRLSPSPSSLPSNFPASARSFSTSPADLSHSAQPSASGSSERHLQRSPVLPRPSEARMYPSRRVSASLSPTVPTSGLSGLDVLVQAATEERERIDVHRRLSGGEDPQPSLNYISTSRRASLSPVESRSHGVLHVPPAIPPYTLSSQSTSYWPANSTDTYHEEQGIGESSLLAKGPRSPESSRLHQSGASQTSQYSPRATQLLPDGASRQRSHPPEGSCVKYEHHPLRLEGTSRVPSSSSRDIPASKPVSLYTSSSSSRTTLQKGSSNDQVVVPPLFSHPLSTAEPIAVPYTRRSPPRSRPKPKKPGSAALAIMEKELQGVALTDRNKTEFAVNYGESSTSKHTPRMSQPQTRVERKLQDISSRSRQSNERGAADEEDVDDFFLSAFDSPRESERQIPSKRDKPVAIPFEETREDEYSADRWSCMPSRHHNVSEVTSSPTKAGSSPERTIEMSDQFSPLRVALDRDGEETMSDVEAEILDELADAVGAATSEDERTEFDGHETDNMEVDVENELLSLIDGPSEPSPKSHHHSKPPTSYAQRISAATQDVDFDRMSMPPPDALKTTSSQAKDSKKGSTKPKGKRSTDSAPKAAKGLQAQLGDSTTKPSMSKTSSKSRPTKSLTAEKAKTARMSKEPSTPTSASLPTVSMHVPGSSTPTDGLFPMVTSSGRMITKSKKSAAAAAVAPSVSPVHPSASHSRKRPTTSGNKDGSGSRSRSHSVMPRASVDPEGHREKSSKEDEEKAKDRDAPAEEADEGENDKLYCICRTQYDEDKVMIACDRCDEWYHTQCVNMPDLLVDLVDQFICSNCIAQNPSLNLQTTYKQRCFAGLNHPDPDSAEACHKSSRGAYSKYCSDECGVRYMHRKIEAWTSNGGDVRGLWESVKDAKRREGFVTREPGRSLPKAILAEIQNNAVPEPQGNASEANQVVADEEGRNSIVMRLEEQLQTVVREREELKKELEVLSWRERLLQLASDRAESVGDCGWDQRLVYGDEEWLEFGAGVLESYEETAPNGHSEDNQGMDVDGQAGVGVWWCHGKKKCERHMGWQRVRAADMERERDTKEAALSDLTTREREIRSRIEDVLHPQSRPTGSFPEATFKFKLPNGISEGSMKKSRKKSVAIA